MKANSSKQLPTPINALIIAAAALLLNACLPEYSVLPPQEQPQTGGEANTTIIYECNERLFAEKDAFKAIENYIPVLADMGFNALWLMPIHPRGTDDKSLGSPYCVKDYTAIDPAFGTMADLKALVQTAHEHKMIVLLDWIANHTSWDNRWVKQHPDWYQGPQTADEKLWADVTFLNYNVQQVQDTMKACMTYWIDNADIDGFRCDYADGAPVSFWTDVIQLIRQRKSNALMIAETSDARLYNAGFDLLYSWSYLGAIENLYTNNGTFAALLSAHKAEYNATPDTKQRMRYITTHDETAITAPASIYRSAQGELSAFCLTAFLAGVPMVYSSQELGHMNTINFFNYNILDFPKDASQLPAVTKQLATILNAYHQTAVIRNGVQRTGSLNAKVHYIEYTTEKETLLVICNTANAEQEVKYPMKHQGLTATNLITNETMLIGATTTLQPYEYQILKH